MDINIKELKTVNEVNNVVNELVTLRHELMNEVLEKPVISKNTNKEGHITSIDSKKLFVNFECWSSVPVSLDNYQEIIETSEDIRNKINEFIETFKDERRLNLLRMRLVKSAS